MAKQVKIDTIRRLNDYYGFEHLKPMIADRLVGTARELLNDLTLSVTQVGDMLGFEYPQHFVHFFRRRTGRTPKKYRSITAN